jgi:hypothetical protein
MWVLTVFVETYNSFAVVRADLGQVALQPQPVQAQPHVVPGGQREPQLRRRAHDEEFQLLPRLGGAQLMQVVDDQPNRAGRDTTSPAPDRTFTTRASSAGVRRHYARTAAVPRSRD